MFKGLSLKTSVDHRSHFCPYLIIFPWIALHVSFLQLSSVLADCVVMCRFKIQDKSYNLLKQTTLKPCLPFNLCKRSCMSVRSCTLERTFIHPPPHPPPSFIEFLFDFITFFLCILITLCVPIPRLGRLPPPHHRSSGE